MVNVFPAAVVATVVPFAASTSYSACFASFSVTKSGALNSTSAVRSDCTCGSSAWNFTSGFDGSDTVHPLAERSSFAAFAPLTTIDSMDAVERDGASNFCTPTETSFSRVAKKARSNTTKAPRAARVGLFMRRPLP